MKAAALIARQRKGTDKTHKHVLGGMRLRSNAIQLYAIEQGPGMNIIRPIQLTANWSLMYKWRTKQAAHQFMHRHALKDLHIFDTHFMDILPAPQGR